METETGKIANLINRRTSKHARNTDIQSKTKTDNTTRLISNYKNCRTLTAS